MSYTTQKLPDEPIVMQMLGADYNNATEAAGGIAEALAMLDAQSEPVFYIFDISRASLTLDDVIFGANVGARGDRPVYRHPNVRETVIISGSSLVKLAAKGLKTATFGHTTVQVFDTLDEALAYCREKCAAG